jgi:hypothetical protein
VRVARRRARILGLCCLLCAAGCGHRRERTLGERPLEVSDVLPGSWVQVWPARGVLDTLVFRSSGDVAGSVRGLWLPFEYHEHLTWRTDFAPVPGGLCISEGPWTGGVRAISCDGFRIAGDTLLLARGARYMRLRPAGPAISAWSEPAGVVLEPAPGESVHALAPLPPGVTGGGRPDTTSPRKTGP